MIKSILIAMFSVTLMTGCGLSQRQYRDVPVPVYRVPAPPNIEKPRLPIHDLTSSDIQDTQRVIRAYIVSTRLLINYAEALREIVDTYAELARRTESHFIEPVFTMAFSLDQETSVEITELERLRMVAQARSVQQDAILSFANIIDQYNQRKQEILEEFNNEASDD